MPEGQPDRVDLALKLGRANLRLERIRVLLDQWEEDAERYRRLAHEGSRYETYAARAEQAAKALRVALDGPIKRSADDA